MALRACSENDFERALVYIESRQRFLAYQDIKTPLLRSYLLFVLGRNSESLNSNRKAVKLMNNVDALGVHDRTYLLAFSEKLHLLATGRDPSENVHLKSKNFDVERVKSRILQNFPMDIR